MERRGGGGRRRREFWRRGRGRKALSGWEKCLDFSRKAPPCLFGGQHREGKGEADLGFFFWRGVGEERCWEQQSRRRQIGSFKRRGQKGKGRKRRRRAKQEITIFCPCRKRGSHFLRTCVCFWEAMNACTSLVFRVSPDPIRLGDCGKS